MDKTILKKFATESRQDLKKKIETKIKSFYVDEEFSKVQNGDIILLYNKNFSLPLSKEDYEARNKLIKRIKDVGIEQVIEEAAFTWFNRFVAIRYMEIHNFLPITKDNQSLGIRVLSSCDNTPDPEILKFSNLINPDLDIDFKKEKYIELKEEKKFEYVLLLVCKKLGKVIPQVFGGRTDYIDLLIPDNLLNDTGYVTKIVNDIPIENFNQVEIIGWLYQYYNQNEKDRVMQQKKVYKKNEIPYVTQLFTPDWIVKYMVENSLGKFWIENNADLNIDSLKNNWKYLISSDIKKLKNSFNPTEISFIDICCGSGHILVYAFEIFYQMYLNAGYNKNLICELILQNNIYGLDIDDRAIQLSILSILLKAREYDKDLFKKDICQKLNILSINESNSINFNEINYELSDHCKKDCIYLIEKFYNAKETGSLIKLEKRDYTQLKQELEKNNTIFMLEFKEKINPIIKVAEILQRKFTIIVTNPPYMGNSFLSDNMKKFLTQNYNEGKNDLCTAFMQIDMLDDNGYYAMINQQVWMFTVLYENLRKWFLNNRGITSMIHLGTRAFEEISGEVVSTTTFVMTKLKSEKSLFYRLIDVKDSKNKEKEFLLNKNNYQFSLNIEKFNLIQGNPFAYWLNEKIFSSFEKIRPLSDNYECKVGLGTGDNTLFLRYWFEVDIQKKNIKWFPYNKAGGYKRWYGNQMYYFNWENDGVEIKKCKNSYVRNSEYYFKEAVSWCDISTGLLSARIYPKGFGFDSCSPSVFPLKGNNLFYILGFINCKVAQMYMDILSPTIHYNTGSMSKVPLIVEKNEIEDKVKECIEIVKNNWDSYEVSLDFKRNPLVINDLNKIEDAIEKRKEDISLKRKRLKENEEYINHYFINLYNFNDELSPEVNVKDLSVKEINPLDEIKEFINYSVGCMFGRYSLDNMGLVYAGGYFDNEKYHTFAPDEDNIIPICDEAYFPDDIMERFKTFLIKVYGKENLNSNMNYIANVLNKRGTETSEERIRRYFNDEFYQEHLKIYQKTPIYWLFESGKKNGFKALVYMHRYSENLIPKIRLDYLHRMQNTYTKLLSDVNYKLTTELSLTEKKDILKKQTLLNAKLQETKEYDEKIAHLANQRIDIDLDDGVKINYEKFKDILAKIK